MLYQYNIFVTPCSQIFKILTIIKTKLFKILQKDIFIITFMILSQSIQKNISQPSNLQYIE